eukprot:13226641-Alexandrium_andersonii.AAC.1
MGGGKGHQCIGVAGLAQVSRPTRVFVLFRHRTPLRRGELAFGEWALVRVRLGGAFPLPLSSGSLPAGGGPL